MEFRGPPTPVGQGLCGFKKGSLDVKISFFRYNFAKHELAKLLIIYMTTRDYPRSKPHGPILRSAAHEILKIIESPLG